MADFFQPGVVATIHRLGVTNLEEMEGQLKVYSRANPVGLILPALYREFQHPAMRLICQELRQATWLKRIVVAIGRCQQAEFEEAKDYFSGFSVPVTALWMEDPRMQTLLEEMTQLGLTVGDAGKGRTCWLSIGYLLAAGDCEVIGLHDCDIRGYSRDLFTRLVYPLVHPNLGYEFSKGYYARVSDNKLHGRVTRLFFTPIVRAIQDLTPEIGYLRYLDSFRYALAGEFAMTSDLARAIRIPSDWGLEVGVLAEVYRNCATSRICQVDISENYEHKHQELSAGDSSKGLARMTVDIAKSLFRSVAQEGFTLTVDHFRTLEVFYTRYAQDTIRRYFADATVNGLNYDLHEEDSAVHIFATSIREAARNFLEDPLGVPQIPNWNRVSAAMPDAFPRLLQIGQ